MYILVTRQFARLHPRTDAPVATGRHARKCADHILRTRPHVGPRIRTRGTRSRQEQGGNNRHARAAQKTAVRGCPHGLYSFATRKKGHTRHSRHDRAARNRAIIAGCCQSVIPSALARVWAEAPHWSNVQSPKSKVEYNDFGLWTWDPTLVLGSSVLGSFMNYLAHGWRFVGQPYVLAGTAAPDWLSVIDRKIRLRLRTAA